ncbi:DNA-binding response regulator [Paenibacillus marchantiophytorum]|uniref:DNA-binding response regulator n=1 Tax=Paenibacillus marchantiophytorum TaxID=1619310 RepID=A0ABQ2BQS8_9BACL|nr:response regulator transcription factor [Paenibacillus marchantiophytorum]GGI43566.1 DNA-binding response regulator [Paenibacillus marchantiophytorum]
MRVIVAEDQGMLRGALSALLDLEEDIEVVGQAANGEQALDMIQSLKPDLCIMDIEMPKLTGLDVAENIKQNNMACRVVILTTFSRSGYFQRAMKAGVHGYLLKDAPIQELSEALRKVEQGGRAISPELALQFWEAENPLTSKEQDILKLIAQGLSAGEMAKQLFLSSGTIRNYVSEILQKLEAKNRIDAIAIAEKNGWLS